MKPEDCYQGDLQLMVEYLESIDVEKGKGKKKAER